jgi:hypothetical protein
LSFLLDTNVVSEFAKPTPDPNVISWLEEIDEDRAFISVISLAEIRRGIELLPTGRRRQRLTQWLTEELPARFEERVLTIDRLVAESWGVIMAQGQKAGTTIGSMDAFVAATAEAYSLTLVTRNTRDFAAAGVSLLNPWIGRT